MPIEREPAPTVPKATRFIVLPFVSKKAEGFSKRLQQLVTTNYPQVDFNVAFKTPCQVDRYFPFKNNVQRVEHRSMVVYRLRYSHDNCEASYIGKTKRILGYRVNEHRKGICNFSYVAFALNRISLIGKDHGKLLTFMSEIGFKKYIVFSLLISAIFSWIKFFKFEVNYFYPGSSFPLSNEMKVISPDTIQFNDFYFIYNSISDIVNYLVFVVICIIIDICMVVQLRRVLNEREKKSESLNQKQNQTKKAENEEAVNKRLEW